MLTNVNNLKSAATAKAVLQGSDSDKELLQRNHELQ